jgi:prevent-host-death family protein
MSERGARPARVGVRELRQNLSVYLDRVKAGETLEVTEYGQPVARLGPRAAGDVSPLERMVAEGRATAPTQDLRAWLRDEPPLDWPAGAPSLTDVLLEMREEERG